MMDNLNPNANYKLQVWLIWKKRGIKKGLEQ